MCSLYLLSVRESPAHIPRPGALHVAVSTVGAWPASLKRRKQCTLLRDGLHYSKRCRMRYILNKLFSFSTYRVFTISGFVGFVPKGAKKCHMLLVNSTYFLVVCVVGDAFGVTSVVGFVPLGLVFLVMFLVFALMLLVCVMCLVSYAVCIGDSFAGFVVIGCSPLSDFVVCGQKVSNVAHEQHVLSCGLCRRCWLCCSCCSPGVACRLVAACLFLPAPSQKRPISPKGEIVGFCNPVLRRRFLFDSDSLTVTLQTLRV